MSHSISSVITATGSYIPTHRIKNEDFLQNHFLDSTGAKINKSNQEIIEKFLEITTIAERRYVEKDLVTSDIAFFAAENALESSSINREDLDYIIVAHNFGDVVADSNRTDLVPSLAARVKYKLGIANPETVAYDLPFGCPGWLQAVIQADYFIRSGDAKKILVIGAEVLSRVTDPHDRDTMLYSDGAGAAILEGVEGATKKGVLAHKTRSDTLAYSNMLFMGQSYNVENQEDIFLKMNGRKLYQYALETVPQAIKDCLIKANIHIRQVKTVLIHQANGKMDDAILKRLYDLYDIDEVPESVMPMTIGWLGNSSVATIPTLLDLVLRNKVENHGISEGDILVFASVGAGMNINALIYKY